MDTNGHIPLYEDYVSFETAKLLKEKGFDIYVRSYYEKNEYKTKEEFSTNNALWNYNISSFRYSAPTIQMAMKWLREVYKLHVDVDPSEGDWNPTVITLEDWTCAEKFGDNIPIQDSYEEACEAAIKYCLENLI